MSVGFHYLETAQQALTLQLIPKKDAPAAMGRVAGTVAIAQLLSFGAVAIAWKVVQPTWETLFLVAGGVTIVLALLAMAVFPKFDGTVVQNKGIVLRKRYGLYYG